MDDFTVKPQLNNDVMFNILDDALYDYNLNSFSLVPLQEVAESKILENMVDKLIGSSSFLEIIGKSLGEKDTEYIAKFTKEAEEKIRSGEWKLGIKSDTGEAYGVIRDAKTGQSTSLVDLVKNNKDVLGNLPQLAAIQHQLKDISKKLDEINRSVKRVEQGQYNDRYAGFFSARQKTVEGLSVSNESIKQELLISAIKSLNDTISKLMLTIQQDAQEFINPKTNSKVTRELERKLQDSIGFLNASIQLNIVVYTALEETDAIKAVLKNYQSFVKQVLLKESSINQRSVAWLMDNNKKGNTGQFLELSTNVVDSIQKVLLPVENKRMELLDNGEKN